MCFFARKHSYNSGVSDLVSVMENVMMQEMIITSVAKYFIRRESTQCRSADGHEPIRDTKFEGVY